MSFSLYGCNWPEPQYQHPIDVELYAIRQGGYWSLGSERYGLGIFEHLMAARKWVWPSRYRHRWTDLLYHNFIENDVTIMMGCASSQKTSHASEFVLLNYWARPFNTLALITTVNIEKLESAIFGEIKMLWQQGRDAFPWLAGNIID